ncbi:hypothetical protein KRMM14A1259_68880 [Krasilnikovia sp. MM14-A1259]
MPLPSITVIRPASSASAYTTANPAVRASDTRTDSRPRPVRLDAVAGVPAGAAVVLVTVALMRST